MDSPPVPIDAPVLVDPKAVEFIGRSRADFSNGSFDNGALGAPADLNTVTDAFASDAEMPRSLSRAFEILELEYSVFVEIVLTAGLSGI